MSEEGVARIPSAGASGAVGQLNRIGCILQTAGIDAGLSAVQRVEKLVGQRDEAWVTLKTERELQKKGEARLHDLESASWADSVQGEAAWKQRAEVAEVALAAMSEENDTHAALKDALTCAERAERECDEAKAALAQHEARVREIVGMLNTAEVGGCPGPEAYENPAVLACLRVGALIWERDAARAELRQIKEGLQAMGRLSKLAFALASGDADPEDVEADKENQD